MANISIIFVTNRRGWEDILHDNLSRQTFKDYEIIVADENPDDATILFGTHFKPRPKEPGDVWNINKAYNDAISKATGRLLVFLQDYIWIPDDGLERFWDMYEKYPNALVSGVGHKAENGIEGLSELDQRVYGTGDFCLYTEWELNWASCPREIMPQFHGAMDRYYGGENQYVAKKAMHEGAELRIDRTNRCIGYSQKECGGRPENWEEMHSNKEGRLAAFLELLERSYPQPPTP